jgi:hypothetical protein
MKDTRDTRDTRDIIDIRDTKLVFAARFSFVSFVLDAFSPGICQ